MRSEIALTGLILAALIGGIIGFNQGYEKGMYDGVHLGVVETTKQILVGVLSDPSQNNTFLIVNHGVAIWFSCFGNVTNPQEAAIDEMLNEISPCLIRDHLAKVRACPPAFTASPPRSWATVCSPHGAFLQNMDAVRERQAEAKL
jgi:hypothetical protein